MNEAFSPMKLRPIEAKGDSISNYGFGWMLRSSPRGRVVHHSGGNPGYNTHIVRYIDARKTIILLCNNAHPKFNELLAGVGNIVEDSNPL